MTDDGKEKDKKIIRFKPAPTELEKSIGSMMGAMKQLSDLNKERVQFIAEQFGLEGELDRTTRRVLHCLQFTISESGSGDPPPFMWGLSLGWLYRAFNFAYHPDVGEHHRKFWRKAAEELSNYDPEWTNKSLDELADVFGIRTHDHAELCSITEGLAMFNELRDREGRGSVEATIYIYLVNATCLGYGLEIEDC